MRSGFHAGLSAIWTGWTKPRRVVSFGASIKLAEDPFDQRISSPLTNQEGLRKSRVGAWRIIFTVDEPERIVFIVMIERRGQVYQRI
jgi:mRNA-degrading endonuclease RelE of RelBE toxin-antitoxin system